MFNFDALPPSCTDCGNANPASTYGCPRFANEQFRERGRGSSSRRRVETSARARPRRDGSETASGRARAVDDVSDTLPRLDAPNIDLARLGATSRDVIPMTCEWPLREDDVVVLYGCVPSRMKYFALTPYLYRLGVSGTLVFASLGDSLSMAENDDLGVFTRLSTSASPNVAPGTFLRMHRARGGARRSDSFSEEIVRSSNAPRPCSAHETSRRTSSASPRRRNRNRRLRCSFEAPCPRTLRSGRRGRRRRR